MEDVTELQEKIQKEDKKRFLALVVQTFCTFVCVVVYILDYIDLHVFLFMVILLLTISLFTNYYIHRKIQKLIFDSWKKEQQKIKFE